MTKISILGCGWLGLPLAEAFLADHYLVAGSTTTKEKMPLLENTGIHPFLITLESTGISGPVAVFLQGSQTLIIDIPPKLRGNSKEDFVGKIAALLPYIEKSTVENVLFISSTSVYGDTHTLVTEKTFPDPDSEGGKQLILAEQLLQRNKNFKTTVLRFGGLIGKDRHPVKFLAGRENLANPNAPINLIHQEDCIGIILKIIEQNSWNECFNAVAPYHPSREEYYTQKALELNLVLPKFNASVPSRGKTILSDKVETILKHTFTQKKL